MGKKLDVTGQKFGKLTALYNTEQKQSNGYVWNFKCDCGSVVERGLKNVRFNSSKGITVSCGVCTKRKSNAFYLEMHNTYKQNAKKRGLSFLLTKEQTEELAKRNCFYCGAEPRKQSHKDGRIFYANGIDRSQNDRGYTPTNSVACCFSCNRFKSTMNAQEFLSKIETIYLHQNNGNDDDAKTFYVRERNAGMRGSSILKHIYDFSEVDNLQVAEIKAILNTLIDEHIIEHDELNP